jgi:broad specificity phosphatase PhoE
VLPEVTDFCRLLLLRHPELDPACAHVAVGAGKAELSRRGRQRAVEWNEVLSGETIDSVVAADRAHCSQPGAVLARARGLEVGLEPRLRDQHMGAWEGRPWEELVNADAARVKEFFEHFTDSAPPEGESLGQAVERALAWWTETAPQGVGKTIAVVSSGGLLSGFAAAMLGMRLSRCLSLYLPHGGIGVVDVFANGVRLTAWNLDGHSR